MKGKMLKRVFTVGLSAAMFMSMSAGVFAADSGSTLTYEVPTKPMTVDKNLIKCAAHAQADATPEILGITNTTDRGSEVPAEYSLKHAQESTLIGTFGTDINSNPNPYLYNWAYNSWAKENGQQEVENHTLGGINGSPNSVDTEVVPELGTVRSLYYRPDILVGTGGADYSTMVADLDENKDAESSNDYDPYIVNYKMDVCDDFLTTLYEMANDCEEIMKADSSKKLRYGDPVEISDKMTNYVVGIQSYILQQLAKNGAQKKTVAIFDPVNSKDGVFLCVDDNTSTQGTTQHSRAGEFLAQTTNNVVQKLGKEQTTAQIAGRGGSTQSKACYNLTATEIVQNADVIVTGGVQNGGDKSEAEIREMLLQYIDPNNAELVNKVKTMPVMSSSFKTVGSIGANSIENLLGMAYWPAFVYPEYVNPVQAAVYWYHNFYHVTDNAKLEQIINATMSSASKPENVTATTKGYSETAFQNLIDQGMNYYNTNKSSINNAKLNTLAAHLNHDGKTSKKAKSGSKTTVTNFTDVSSNDWFYSAVSYAVENGIVNGMSNTTFAPQSNTTRGQFAVMLYRSQKNPVTVSINPFKDVASSDYYYDAIRWAYGSQIINGTSADEFTPGASVTREDMAVMFYRARTAAGKNSATTADLSSYPDASSVDSYATEAMQWAVGNGLINGSDGQLQPRANATRAQVAQMFQNYANIK